MQRHGLRHFTAYTITAVAYLCIVALIYYTQSHHFVSSQEPKESVIKMSMSEFVPEVLAPPEPSVEKVVEPVVEPEPVIEKEPEVVKEIVPEPVVEKLTPKVVKKVQKKIEKKKLVKKKVKKKKKQAKKKKSKKKKTSRRQASKQQRHSSKAEKNKFYSALRRKIDSHKFYPRIAKKRGMEGKVKVEFTILATGRVGNITVKGPRIFHNSAKNAVKSTFPISVKKVPITLPASINITLRYQIR